MDDVKKIHGLFRATVSDNKDPGKLRRLRVVSQATGDQVTDWIWPVEIAGTHTSVPEIGQGVWVFYIGGDPEYPVWLGVYGKSPTTSKPLKLLPLKNTVSLTGLSPYLITTKDTDGTTVVDVTASLVAMANKLKNHETRIHTLETTPDIDV
jgi:Type VI secretion system/phage-baseplate injector OB domain